MEVKISIAEILKDKPQGTKLYDLLYNVDVELDTISTTDTKTVVWCTNETDNNTTCHRGYSEFGTVRGCSDGLQILLPSKSMRDWRKFAWKRGDVLVNSRGLKKLFDRWANDNYTSFYAKTINLVEDGFLDTNLHTLASEKEAKSFIKCIEEKLGGKLNRETLKIEKAQPEFKEGDIVSLEIRYIDSEDVIVEAYIVHGDYSYGENLNFYAGWSDNTTDKVVYNSFTRPDKTSVRKELLRYATEEEKQQLFDALAKEGKAWDADKKMIIDLKQKVELKPFDKVLVRDSQSDKWRVNLFGYIDKDEYYHCAFANWVYCIPYAGNEHLLGTTKDVEG